MFGILWSATAGLGGRVGSNLSPSRAGVEIRNQICMFFRSSQYSGPSCQAGLYSQLVATRFYVEYLRLRSTLRCSTSLPGGNQVDGLPPAPSALRVIRRRLQTGAPTEPDLNVIFPHVLSIFSRSCGRISLRVFFSETKWCEALSSRLRVFEKLGGAKMTSKPKNPSTQIFDFG